MLSRDRLCIIYTSLSFWKEVRKECSRILKNRFRLNPTLSLVGDTSYLGEQSHHIIKFLFLLFFKKSADVIGLSHLLLFYIYAYKLCSYFLREKLQMRVRAVDSVKIGDYLPLLSVALLAGHHRELSCTPLEFKTNFLQSSEVFTLLLYSLMSSELVNSDISERKKKLQRLIVWMLLRLLLTDLTVGKVSCLLQDVSHKSKGREQCHILFLSYLNRHYGSPCLPVLGCCLQCQTLLPPAVPK